MKQISIRYLSAQDVESLAMTNAEILDAIETSVCAQGAGDTVIEPRMHLIPDPAFQGHFNVLRGYIAPLGLAVVKIVGDYHNNHKRGLPSEFTMLNLMDAQTGQPRAILNATAITEMLTGAVTAIGAKYLTPSRPRVLGHVGARGTAYWNVRLLDHLVDPAEIRVHSRRAGSRQAFADRLRHDLGKPIVVTDNWQSCLEGAGILVEASRLPARQVHFKTAWIKPGALVIPYGTMSAVEDDITDVMDKVVVDDWRQCLIGPFGCLRRQVDTGKVTRETIHGELGEICAGKLPGREGEAETAQAFNKTLLVWGKIIWNFAGGHGRTDVGVGGTRHSQDGQNHIT